jgi:NADPH:quinone reductase-like Zn-dependent oxidoreductase
VGPAAERCRLGCGAAPPSGPGSGGRGPGAGVGADVGEFAVGDRLRGLGAAEIIDYHDPNWPGQARGGFDGALTAAIGTAEAALPLVRDGGRLCSLASDAPAGERGITSTDLYVRPDAAQLAQLATQVSQGTLRITPEVHPLQEGPAAFTRVAAGQASGRKLVLIP